jgi:xylan 1,4-beta-xylosidase
MYNRIASLTFMSAFLAVTSMPAQVIQGSRGGSAGAPANKTLRYVNPLPVDNSQRIGDPIIIRFQDKYWLYLSGGMTWSSDDLVSWTHHPVTLPPGRRVGAPHVLVYEGYIYLTGNNVGLFRSRDPRGPFEFIGDFTDGKGGALLPGSGGGVFDAMLFADDDKRLYLYFSGRSVNGIYGVELDRKDLTKFIGAPKHFFRLEAAHAWENFGSFNEYQGVGWLEAPWMTKRNGTYYLQYSGSGTDWKTYAIGIYTGKSPLGPFTYSSRSPVLVHKNGLINGTGHHCIIETPEGTVWTLYTMLYRNWNRMFERRIGMDPVGWDEKGNMIFGGPSDRPQWGPGVKAKAWLGNDSGSLPLTEDKSYAVSSEAPGLYAPNAFDGSLRTWWAPAENDAQPSLTLNLGSSQPEDPIQEFIIDSSRILFTIPSGGGGAAAVSGPRQYKIEVSLDGKSFTTAVDKTRNSADNVAEFDEIKPVQCRYVRLSITGWPKGLPVGVFEFTIFGRPVAARPH